MSNKPVAYLFDMDASNSDNHFVLADIEFYYSKPVVTAHRDNVITYRVQTDNEAIEEVLDGNSEVCEWWQE